MAPVGKTVKIVKRRETPAAELANDHPRTKRQSTREMVKVVTSWIEERREAGKQTSFLPSPLQQTVPEHVA